MAKEKTLAHLCSHTHGVRSTSYFSTLIQVSQIFLNLCAFHKSQRIPKLCCLILCAISQAFHFSLLVLVSLHYLPSENLFFLSGF